MRAGRHLHSNLPSRPIYDRKYWMFSFDRGASSGRPGRPVTGCPVTVPQVTHETPERQATWPALMRQRTADQQTRFAERASLPAVPSEEPDVNHRVQLDVVRRRTGHVVLLIEEAEPADIDAPVDVVPGVQAHPVP